MDAYQSAKEEIKRAVDIVELIGQFVQLRRAGQNFLGLCPFHSEKDPSFTVSPAKQMFHCFGCKKGGDLFAFWMAYHNVSFPQAMRELAERYHIALPEKEQTPSEKRRRALKESLLRINEIAADYFHQVLTSSGKGAPGRAYVKKRGIPQESVEAYRLGYAPDEWRGLSDFLAKKRVDPEKAVAAGLIIAKQSNRSYDRFRGRIMFPIFNLTGQVVGFGGRVLDDALPKYLNTPETPVFQKGTLLYGLHLAYESIRQSGRVVIVEGYTDVLALKRYGFHSAVATLGTALTREHIRRLKGYAREAVVVFDADAAGKTAAMKSLAFFLDEGLPARVTVLPQDHDPDTYVNEQGLEAFSRLLDRSVPMFDFYLDLKLSERSDQIERQIDVLQDIVPVLWELRNSAQRSLYVRRFSERSGIPEAAVLEELSKWKSRQSWSGERERLRESLSATKARRRDDLYLLDLLVHHSQITDKLLSGDIRRLLSDPTIVGIFDTVAEIYHDEGPLPPEAVLDRLEGDEARERFREVMLGAPIFRESEVGQALKDFEDRIHRMKISESKQRAVQQGDLEGLRQIPKRIKERWG
jgi:DNA primase